MPNLVFPSIPLGQVIVYQALESYWNDSKQQESGEDFNVIKDSRFEGSIHRMIQEIGAFLAVSLRDYFFLDMGYVKDLNEGVKRIYKVMNNLRLATPEYRQHNSYVYLMLKNNVAQYKRSISSQVMQLIEQKWGGFNNTQQEILTLLLSHQPEATLADFSKYVTVSEQAIRSNLKTLISADIIEKGRPRG